MEHPLISVIIPVYNMEQYLARCLDSVLNNTYRNLEVICVDDGSRDRSLEILREYEERDSRIIVIAKENGGVSSARNAGLDRMTGEFVTFLDSDDFIHPQYFEILLQAQAIAEADFVIGQYQKVTDDDLPVAPETLILKEEDVKALDCKQLFKNTEYRRYCTIRLIRAKHIGDLRFRLNMPYGEDTTFIAELWEQAPQMKACVIPSEIYYYYYRESSASNSSDEGKKIAMLQVFDGKVRQSPVHETIYLDHIIRFALPNREIALYINRDKTSGRAYSALLRNQLPLLKKTALYTKKEKSALALFICFPRLRWKYRVWRDPGLRKWEKNARKRYHTEKRRDIETETNRKG